MIGLFGNGLFGGASKPALFANGLFGQVQVAPTPAPTGNGGGGPAWVLVHNPPVFLTGELFDDAADFVEASIAIRHKPAPKPLPIPPVGIEADLADDRLDELTAMVEIGPTREEKAKARRKRRNAILMGFDPVFEARYNGDAWDHLDKIEGYLND